MISQFIMDGISYNVNVLSMRRFFEVKDVTTPRTVQSGDIHRDLAGTYYNYTIVVSERNGDRAALDAFWDAISIPVSSHVCVFPYNQNTITQNMYVKTGYQDIFKLHKDGAEWDKITVQYYAKAPKVTA